MIHKLSFKKVRWRYLNLIASLLSFRDVQFDQTKFLQFLDILSDELKVDKDYVISYISDLLGRSLNEKELERLSWFLAANTEAIRNYRLDDRFDYFEGLETFAAQIRQISPKEDKLVLNLDILSGPIAGKQFAIPVGDPRRLFKKLYSSLKASISIKRYDLLEGLLLYIKINRGRVPPQFDLRTVKASPFMKNYNKQMLDVRISLRKSAFSCRKGGDVLCSECKKACLGRPLFLIS